jgi:hypothetical protein
MLPQSPGVDPATCIPELVKCVEQYGNVGHQPEPRPVGGHWTSPPLTDRHWYPIYEKMVEYDIPAMIHVSTSCNACFHTTGAHYLNADTTAFMQCLTSDLFKDFPTLKFVIPHGGGAVPYHWGRFRGLAQELKKPLLKDHLLNNIFFDTCVYHQPGIDLLTKVIPVENILFASEMIGAVRGIDPETGTTTTTPSATSRQHATACFLAGCAAGGRIEVLGWIGVIGLGWDRGGRALLRVPAWRASLTFAAILRRAGRTEREISALASGRVGVSPAAKWQGFLEVHAERSTPNAEPDRLTLNRLRERRPSDKQNLEK